MPTDKEWWINKVKYDWHSVHFVPSELLADKEIALAALQQNGYTLRYFSPQLQDDESLVLVAIAQEPRAFMFASEQLRADQDVALWALSKSSAAFYYASSELQRGGLKRYLEQQETLHASFVAFLLSASHNIMATSFFAHLGDDGGRFVKQQIGLYLGVGDPWGRKRNAVKCARDRMPRST